VSTRRIIESGVSRGLRLSRGTADRAIRLAGPRVAGVVGELTSRFRRDRGRIPTTETFMPSRPDGGSAAAPNPATIARNIAPQRPMAVPAKQAAVRKSAPGAKLPPRPRTT
jgi:hypothetical protein